MQNLSPGQRWATEITYTVRPTSDPDVVTVTPPCSLGVIRYRDDVADLILDDLGAVSLAARRWFDKHPVEPEFEALPIPEVGEYVQATYSDGHVKTGEVEVHWVFEDCIGVQIAGGYGVILTKPRDESSLIDIVEWHEVERPKPAHPLADAKVGEWWAVTWASGAVTVEHIRTANLEAWPSVTRSARQVYVIPKAEADRKLSKWVHAESAKEVLRSAL